MSAYVGYQLVTCRRCKRTYTCTPEDDYYENTTTTDGVDLDCLLAENGMGSARVIVVDERDE